MITKPATLVILEPADKDLWSLAQWISMGTNLIKKSDIEKYFSINGDRFQTNSEEKLKELLKLEGEIIYVVSNP